MSHYNDAERIDIEPEILEADRKSNAILAKVVRVAKLIPFARHAVAMTYALRDPDVPMAKKALIAGALLYFLSPLDLIPDIMAGIGYTDDAVVVMAAFKAVQDIISVEHYERADIFLA